MTNKFFGRAIALIIAVTISFASLGCGKKAGLLRVIVNERPQIALTAAPVNESDTAYYAYKISWSGYDPDGRIDHYQFAVDPTGGVAPETTWIRTSKNEETVFFSASRPDTNSGPFYRANDPHTFVIRAVDNQGAQSANEARSFFSFTIAPTIRILNPSPSHLGEKQVTPSVRISWVGRDEDGVFTQKPKYYKYRLLGPGDAEYTSGRAKADPRAARRYFASTNFAGWDSTGADVQFAQFTDLTPTTSTGPYVFVVIGFDEAGAYSADWSLDTNMLQMGVGYAGTLGPTITFFNEFFNYTYPSGGYAPNDELSWVRLEIPAGIALTVNWLASPPEGAAMEWYRWKLDGDVGDETPRTNEATDWYHWSQMSIGTTRCTIGPFPGREGGGTGVSHNLYVEAMDNTGVKSIGTVTFSPVSPSWDAPNSKDLLIVDDTRLELDYNTTSISGIRANYTSEWPAAAELDTFLYAVGGSNWRRPATGRGGVTPPGLFSGYSFDTVGTRQGYEIATSGVPLSLLGRYHHVLWLVDRSASTRTGSPTDIVNALSTMRFMNTPGQASTLSSYIYAGGKVWLAGGAGAYTSLIEYNARGSRANDLIYGAGYSVFSSSAGELIPGRMMNDYARWQSELVANVVVTNINKSSRAIGGWSNPGQNYVGTITAPDYSALPPSLRRRSRGTIADSLPPSRRVSQENSFYLTGAYAVEYLTQPNAVIEDKNPDALLVEEISTLDTLYELQGGPLATINSNIRPVAMTYYHGMTSPPFVFSGVSIWDWTKPDCIGMVDFVLQRIWGLQRRPGAPDRLAPPARAGQPGLQPSTTTVQRPGNARLPLGKTRE